jgi:hypothetical protein
MMETRSIAASRTVVIIESDSSSGKWVAKTGKNEDGRTTVIFFRRSGKQSLFQPLVDLFAGIRSGRAAAVRHLGEHGMNAGMSPADMDAIMQKLISSPNKMRRPHQPQRLPQPGQ